MHVHEISRTSIHVLLHTVLAKHKCSLETCLASSPKLHLVQENVWVWYSGVFKAGESICYGRAALMFHTHNKIMEHFSGNFLCMHTVHVVVPRPFSLPPSRNEVKPV